VTLVGFDLTLDVAASVEIPGTMTGTGNVIKSGSGTLLLGGIEQFQWDAHASGRRVGSGAQWLPATNVVSYALIQFYADNTFAPNATFQLMPKSVVHGNMVTNTIQNLVVKGARLEAFSSVFKLTGSLKKSGRLVQFRPHHDP